MNKPYFSLIVLLFPCFSAQAQRDGTVHGTLTDTAAHTAVEDATITVQDAKDSSLIAFSRSMKTGNFVVKGLSFGTYRLLITHVGYGMIEKKFIISDLIREVNLGSVALTDAGKMLASVTVTQEAPPVILKHDTVEFNANAFKTKPNAVVEDLLKKLPGVQVDKDGNIKANGESVKKVLVDGKEFFGNDPKIASKNLPADAVDKVQVFDKKSDQSQFTGFDDGNSQKTINLTIKKDRKYGVFGKATVAGGADAGRSNANFAKGEPAAYDAEGRYEGKFNLNQFNGNRQLSALGMVNNTNKTGFGFQDALGFSGGGIGGALNVGNGGSGVPISDLAGNTQAISTTKAGGVNFNNSWADHLDLNSSYFYNRADDKGQQRETRQYLSPVNAFNQDLLTTTTKYNENQRLNIVADQKIDSLNSIKLTTAFVYQRSSTTSQALDSSVLRADNSLLNEGFNKSQSSMKGFDWSSTALWRHRFAKKGRTLSLNTNLGINQGTGDGALNALNRFYKSGQFLSADTLDQRFDLSTHTNSYGAVLAYTEPLSRKSLLELTYNFSQTRSRSDKSTFDADPSGKYIIPNEQLTNNFENIYTYHREGVAFRHQRKDLNFTVGANLQQAISGNVFGYTAGDSSLHLRFNNLLPNANLQYEFSKYANFRVFYNTYTQQPSVTQLLPVPDNSDPLNIRAGNPGLKQEYYHSVRMSYLSFDPFLQKSFMTMLSVDAIHHRIANDDEVDSVGVRTSRPVNLDGLYKMRGFVNYDFRWRLIRSRVSLSTNITYDHNANLVNGARNTGNTWTAGQGASLQYTHKETVDVTASARLDYNDSRYSLQAGQNMHYWTQTYGVDGSWYMTKALSIESDLSYLRRTGLAAGYNTSPLVWNAGLAGNLIHNRGLLKLQVFDLLKQNTGFSRSTSQNYIDDMSYRVLNRYWLLSFTYSFSRFAGKAGKGPGIGAGSGMDIKIIK